MQLEIFTLCDAATEHAGKLNIIGTFDALRALEAPIAHPQCAIAGRLRFEQIEEGNHRVSLTFADEDGNVVKSKTAEDNEGDVITEHEMKELEAKARDWQLLLTKMIAKDVEVRA